MAAGAYLIFGEAKNNLGKGSIDLDSGVVRGTLHKVAASLSTNINGLSVISSVGNELADGNGYSTSGKTLSAPTWTRSTSTMHFDATAIFWSASGGNLTSIAYLVLWMSGASAGARKLLAFSRLSTAAFNVNDGSRLTITPNASGVFTMV